MKTRLAKIFVLLTVVAAMVAMMAMPTSAVTVTGVAGVEVTVDSNGSISESNGTVTATAKGSFTSAKTATITVTNTSGSTANISFDYSGTNVGSCSLGGVSNNKCSGSKTYLLTAGATTTFTITSRSWSTSSTVTLTMSNFKVEEVAAESDVTVTYGNLGSVTLDSTAVDSGSVNSVSSSTGATFVAVPGSGSKFVAWINPATNAVLSTSATYQLIPTADMTIRAVFANASAAPVFFADGTTKLFESLDAATSYASSSTNKTVTLAGDGTLAAGNYTIPAGVSLNIPYDAAGTLCTTRPSKHENAYTNPSVFRTLNMADGANLTVNGTLSLSAQMSSKYGHNGAPSGPLPFIKMAKNSKITVESGAAMYVYGFITGSGSVEVQSGATVYECFQIADYRGGDATSTIVGKDDEYGVFPFNQYYIQNVEVPMTIHAGATEYGFTALYVTMAGVQESDVPFIGASNSMFILNSGYIVKDYVEGTGRLSVKLYGDVAVSTMSMSMKVSLIGNLTIDSSKYALPIAQHLTLSVESGNITMDQSVAFLPGSELYIREGATCRLGANQKIIIYDLDQWLYNNGANGYSGTTNLPYMQAKYVPGGDGTVGRLKDALIQVDGTIIASEGAVYATTGGANVYSTGTGKITLTPGTETVTYQVITNDTNIGSWPEIALNPIVLTNENSSTVSADVAGDYIYYASTGRWDKPGHFYESVVTAPTCTKKGYTTHTCAVCGDSYVDSETDIVAHNEVIDAAVEATCTTTGLTEGSHCSVCGEVLKAQENVPTIAHTEVIDAAVDADCTTAGKTQGSHCSVCGEVLVAQEEIPALGHTEEVIEGTAATCTESGLTEGKSCTSCGEVLVAQEEIPALGHSYGQWNVVTAPTYTASGEQSKTCGICGDVVTENISVLANPVNTWNIALGDNIGINFVMTLAAEDTVAITVNGEEVAYTVSDGKVSVNVAAAQMNDVIAISVNGLPLANTYSVRGYADVILADASKSQYHDLVKNMLVYGGAAQTYFGYNAGNLASDGITVEAAAPTGDGEVTVSDTLSAVSFYGATLVHETKTAVRVYFTGNIQGLTFTANGENVNVNEKNGMYYVEIAGLNPQDLGSNVNVVVSDGTDSISVAYSPLDYMVRMYNKAGAADAAKALVQALYGYYLAADAFTA